MPPLPHPLQTLNTPPPSPLPAAQVFPLDGSAASHKRRDMRKGGQSGHATTQPDGTVQLHMAWGEPYGGESLDELRLVGDELHVRLHASVGGKDAQAFAVYARKGAAAPPIDNVP